MTTKKLRLYAFCNFYLNTISQGIQTAHVVGHMAKFYRQSDSVAGKLFWEWLEDGNETIIVLNGGMGADVSDAYLKYENILTQKGIPSEIFYEEERAFGSPSPTCWACVLPEEVYDAKSGVDICGLPLFKFSNYNGWRNYGEADVLYEFLNYKNSCSLAR